MFQDAYNNMRETGRNKINLLNNNFSGFLISSILAGMFVGIGIILIYRLGSLYENTQYVKLIMGLFFPIALSLVIVCGSELFTGNIMVGHSLYIESEIKLTKYIEFLYITWIGNFIGSYLIAMIFDLSQFPHMNNFIIDAALLKVSTPFMQLVMKGILCNFLVCLAVWSSFRFPKGNEKMIITFFSLFTIIICGMEHSVANMTLFSAAYIMNPSLDFLLKSFYNLFAVTLGNIIGGIIFVSLPYYFISSKREN